MSSWKVLWKVEIIDIFFSFLKTDRLRRRDTVVWSLLMSSYLFFHQTTKPLALASATIADSFICVHNTSACEQQQAFHNNRLWLEGAVGLGKAVWGMATCQMCALLSRCDCSIAFSPLGAPGQNWNVTPRTGILLSNSYGSCLCSSIARFFDVPWRWSQENISILPFVFFSTCFQKTNRQAFKEQTLRLADSM